MSGISRNRFDGQLGNSAIDLTDPALGDALRGVGLDPKKLDALDGKADGRVAGQGAIDDLYDQINGLDQQTSALSSKQERALWSAVRGAAIAPVPISREQGEALATAAKQLVAEDQPAPGKLSHWALKGESACRNPALSAPNYAGPDAYKCNVFAGEAFYKAGVPFPLSDQSHYASAKNLPGDSRFFQPLATVDGVRPGDVISIWRGRDNGHVEVVTAVRRGPDGQVISITSAGAHDGGSAEADSTAAAFLDPAKQKGRSATVVDGGETYRILRPLAPPVAAAGE
jgi:hypothetical protein